MILYMKRMAPKPTVEDRQRLAQIAIKVAEGRAPACPACRGQGVMAIGEGKPDVVCNQCGAHFDNLRAAWLAAVKKASWK